MWRSLMTVDAAIRVHDGDPDAALDSCRAIIYTGRSIGDEPFALSQLLHIAIGLHATDSARRVLAQGEPSDAALARLQILLLDELTQSLLLDAVKGERAKFVEMMRRIGAGEISVSALLNRNSSVDPNSPRPAITPWKKLLFDNQRAIALELMNEAVNIARRPDAEHPQLWEAWDAEVIRTKVRSTFGIYTGTLPVLLRPPCSATGSAYSRYQCDVRTTAILLAAERHRRKSGDWPSSIAAIDRSILPSAPVNLFSGQAFRMERRDGQLFIYSIGPNRNDEHGALRFQTMDERRA